MRARGRGMTWWARTAQKSGSRLLPNAAVPVWLSSAFKERAMAPGKFGQSEAPWRPLFARTESLLCFYSYSMTRAMVD